MKLIIIFSLLIFTSCGSNDNTPPISIPKMSAVMFDLHSAEAYCKYKDAQPSQTKNTDTLAVYYNSIFKHYDITLAEYNKAFEWYTQHPELLDSVYATIMSTAHTLQKKYPSKSGIPLSQPQNIIDTLNDRTTNISR